MNSVYLKRGTSEKVTVTNIYGMATGSIVAFTTAQGELKKQGRSKFKKTYTHLSGERVL